MDPNLEMISIEVSESDISIKAEDLGSQTPIATPTFAGRLNISDFAFIQAQSSVSVRRSPRKLSSTPSSAQYPGPSLPTRKTPLKRNSDSLSAGRSSSPKKKSRSPAGYAPPSKYAHLPLLDDVIVPDLICLFIGLNPGVQTAQTGHAYAHPSNLFWKLLHSSGCTTRRCRPEEDGDLPRLFSLGYTNIVSRPTRNGSELSKTEMDEGVAVLEDKVRKSRPESVCIVGKSIWESVWRVRHRRGIKKEEFSYGWQDDVENMGVINGTDGEEEWKGARVFVASSTSGLAATLLPNEKEKIWRELGLWVEQRRLEKGFQVLDEIKIENAEV
jgi:G:T/U-mismatch repair DNA glycosylase